jgi:hypothetical protein
MKKQINKLLKQIIIMLNNIYMSLINIYSITFFNINAQKIYFQINYIFNLIRCEENFYIEHLNNIKNTFNNCVRLYNIYINCGCKFLFLNDTYNLQYSSIDICAESQISYLSESINSYNKLLLLIHNFIICINKKVCKK